MTERYARKRAAQVRAELERVHRKRKTVNYQGKTVKGDPRANDPDAQMVRKGIHGQTLAVGGCGRLVVLEPCNYANKCLTCPMWLTSTDDVPALKSFYVRAIRLRQRAVETGNQTVITQQDHIITNLAVRINSLEEDDADGQLGVDDILSQLRVDLAEAISGWEEAKEAGLLLAAKLLAKVGIEVSMSRTANCYDNAAMEAFFDKLKSECVSRMQFHTRIQARAAIFEYLECWYNPVRLHSTLQYVSPLV